MDLELYLVSTVAAVVGGGIGGWIADNNARNFWGWILFGAVLPLVAVPLIIVLPALKVCPHCAERIKKAARVCPHCGRTFFVQRLSA
jgi:MFS family permease